MSEKQEKRMNMITERTCFVYASLMLLSGGYSAVNIKEAKSNTVINRADSQYGHLNETSQKLTVHICLLCVCGLTGGCCSGFRGDGGDPDGEEPRPGGESQRAERNSH